MLKTTGTGYIDVSDSGGFVLPVGTTANRPITPVTGMIRYNTADQRVELYDGNQWGSIAGSSDPSIVNTQQYQSLQWNGTAWVNSYPSIQHLSDIDRLNNPSNGDTLVWNALNNQYVTVCKKINGDPGRTRTCNLLLRRQALQ